MKKGYFFLFLGFAFLGGAIFLGGKLAAALPKRTEFAALEVNSIPEARIFLDEKEIGKTPYENDRLSSGDFTLRLQPDQIASRSFEQKIKLSSRLLTYVSYIFGPTEKESSGEILTLEKNGKEKGEIVILSDPDGVNISLDGKDEGLSPLILSGFTNGEHELKFFFTGHRQRTLKIKTWTAHKLLVNIKLASLPKEPPPATESAGLRVKILETPNGWLRVRDEPTLSATETARVQTGQSYQILEERDDWIRIKYDEEKSGWISKEYTQSLN